MTNRRRAVSATPLRTPTLPFPLPRVLSPRSSKCDMTTEGRNATGRVAGGLAFAAATVGEAPLDSGAREFPRLHHLCHVSVTFSPEHLASPPCPVKGLRCGLLWPSGCLQLVLRGYLGPRDGVCPNPGPKDKARTKNERPDWVCKEQSGQRSRTCNSPLGAVWTPSRDNAQQGPHPLHPLRRVRSPNTGP